MYSYRLHLTSAGRLPLLLEGSLSQRHILFLLPGEMVGWLLDKDKFLYGGLDTKVIFDLH